jgi:predicted TIM-barrel fold metal-dependent hydrolase
MIVDIHTHFNEPGVAQALGVDMRNPGKGYVMLPSSQQAEFGNFDKQTEVCAKAGLDKRLMSTPFTAEMLSALTTKSSLDVVKVVNDTNAKTVARDTSKLMGLGTVNPLEKSHIAEAERCMGPLGFKGLLCTTSWHGRYLDTEEAWPFWEYAQDKKVPIFLHPVRTPIGHKSQMDQYKLDELIGRPFDTSMCLARMILSGLFDRFPRLQLSVAHMGGGLLPVMGRLNFGWSLGCEGMPERAKIKCKNEPQSYLRRNFHVDTMGLWAPHVREALEVFGADRVMFGTDYGPVPIDPKEHVDIVKAMGLSRDDEEKVFWKNADAFFNLGLAATAKAPAHA